MTEAYAMGRQWARKQIKQWGIENGINDKVGAREVFSESYESPEEI